LGLGSLYPRLVAIRNLLARRAEQGLAFLRRTTARARDRLAWEPPSARVGPPAAVPAGRRIYAVGDIHGRADLLERLIIQLRNDAGQMGPNCAATLIFLGDYVDRGFQSREVINLLLSEACCGFETVFLKGNHELAMLEFLQDPSTGPRWATYGGAETLVSYGVQPPGPEAPAESWHRACEELTQALPETHLQFLNGLPVSMRLGDYLFVHAGVRPGVPLDKQSETDMLWIRDDFINDHKPFDAVIVHGHTPVNAPYRDARRIGVDTGAYMSGRLTAVRLEGEQVDFLFTGV
jgi:serine/threonine protein phosphatase 1